MVDRIKHDAPVLVIGLGRFGAATAGQLDRLGREVLAVDDDETLADPELAARLADFVGDLVREVASPVEQSA